MQLITVRYVDVLSATLVYVVTALQWLQSFVSNRSQYIAVGQERSATTAVSSGVRQGSILGQLLFAMYVSPVVDIVRAHQIKYHQYADDLTLYTALMRYPYGLRRTLCC